MTTSTSENFVLLAKMIKEVKPSLNDQEILLEDSLVDDLGLDSLDLLQLSRRVTRDISKEFDLDAWNEHAETHRWSVGSILATIDS